MFEAMHYSNLDGILSSFTWQDIDFREGDIDVGNCERLYVIIKGVEIPVETINLKAQQTRVGKIQLHIFIDKKYQGRGIATKIYNAFIHQFGGIYSGFGRIMNKEAILSIYSKLSKEPDIEVKYVYGYNKEPIGIEAYLKN
jgi:GNAT superfamily N-acetyltransferase